MSDITTILRCISDREAAEVIGVKRGTLSKWRKRGEGPKFVRISEKHVRYQVTDVQAWLDALKQGGAR